jgi:hypothetical protein
VHSINSIIATVAARTGRRESSRIQQPMAGRGEAPKPYAQGSADEDEQSSHGSNSRSPQFIFLNQVFYSTKSDRAE